MIGTPLKVSDVISERTRGTIKLPEFQRAYVWRRSQVAKLLDSLYEGYPCGSILLWDTDDMPQTREMETSLGRGVEADFRPKIVLDGQQRITSLAHVFDTSKPRYERILFNVETEAFEPYSPRSASDPRWVDVTDFLTGKVNELTVLRTLEKAGVLQAGDSEAEEKIHSRLKRLAAIREHQFPVDVLRHADLETAIEIFNRVNSGGTRLRQAELALARLAFKLPGTIIGSFEQIASECEERGFDLDARFLMRALVCLATGQSRFTDLKSFWERPAREIKMAREEMERGLKATLDFVEGNIGIPGSELLPSSYTLYPLLIVFARRQTISGSEENALRRWFLLVNAFSRYAGGPETKLNQDLSTLGRHGENIKGLLERQLDDPAGEPNVTEKDLERAGLSSSYLPLAYLAVTKRNAVDWFRGIRIRRESFSEDQNVEYHHIFPKKLLNARGTDRYLRDELANIAFLGAKANRRIRAEEPKIYLAAIADENASRLESQLVPMDRSLWELERFEDFLAARRRLLAAAMTEIVAS